MKIHVTPLCQVECISIILNFITNAENPVEEAVLQGIHVEIRSFDHVFCRKKSAAKIIFGLTNF